MSVEPLSDCLSLFPSLSSCRSYSNLAWPTSSPVDTSLVVEHTNDASIPFPLESSV
eukprot:m.178037 g.178037  ORF g.178037 m.178037 type:complete len:56 (+) comp25354_c0_seq3:37-204(+)